MPALREVQLVADGVQLLEAGVDAGLKRSLPQDAGGEGVDRLDVGRIQGPQRGQEALAHLAVLGSFGFPVQVGPDPAAQLPGGFLRERDDHDVADLGGAGAHDLQHAGNEDRRLAGAGAGLEEEAGPQLPGGGLAYRLVQGLAHRVARSWDMRSNGFRRLLLPGALRLASGSTRVWQTS